jgi:hypothetical protein
MSDEHVSSYVSADYVTVHPTDADPLDAVRRSGRPFGVVVDEHGSPMSVVGQAGAAPVLLLDAATPMDAVVKTPGIVRSINGGVPCAVVVDGRDIVGVLPAEVIADYLADNYDVATGAMIDVELHGDPRDASPLRLTCSACGARNAVPFYVSGETMCVNGHPLTVSWG